MKPPHPDALASLWAAWPDVERQALWPQSGWPGWAAWCLLILVSMGLATGLRRWAGSYARRISLGAEADACTLWQALRGIGRQAWCPWRDGLSSLLLGFAAGALSLRLGGMGLALSGLCLGLLALAWFDARSGLLPDALTLPLMVLGWACGPLPLLAASSASALSWAGLSAMAAFYRQLRGVDGFGAGDIKYLAALAGWLGVLPALAVLWGACVLGLVVWAGRGAPRGHGYRFGPWMTVVALPVILAIPVVQSGS